MPLKTWNPQPLPAFIIEILNKKGTLTDGELFDVVKARYASVGFGQLNKTLMRLEIKGKIHVSLLTKGKRRVELIEKKRGT
jgi:hypothetical protein